jgi:peptide deformylase
MSYNIENYIDFISCMIARKTGREIQRFTTYKTVSFLCHQIVWYERSIDFPDLPWSLSRRYLMSVKEILLLGNPKLYEVSAAVRKEELETLKSVVQDLHDTMMDFRKRYGAGRAIAAPQIGVMKRLIYMHITEPVVFVNPDLRFLGDEKMVLWDDCMSFPDLLVRVERYQKCGVRFLDLNWKETYVEYRDDMSELLQHEYDHLNGILAVSRAIDGKSLCLRSQRHLVAGK